MTSDLPPEPVADGSQFDIPVRPTRAYTSLGAVETEGKTRFLLRPAANDTDVPELVKLVLASDRYTHGDWFELPFPVYLVLDRSVSTVYRVAVRDTHVELHVLPETKGTGLNAFYRRLCAVSEIEWSVEVQTTPD